MNIQSIFSGKPYLDEADLSLIRAEDCSDLTCTKGEAHRVMRRIGSLMCQLRPMGSSGGREVWVPLTGSRLQWLRVWSHYVGKVHSLQLRLNERQRLMLSELQPLLGRPVRQVPGLLPLLTHVLRGVEDMVGWILADADGYNSFLSKYIDRYFLVGTVQRAVLERFSPNPMWAGVDRTGAVRLFSDPPVPYLFQGLTVRRYLSVRRIAHEALFGVGQGSDVEVLGAVNQGLRHGAGLDVDDPAVFPKWVAAVKAFHGLDVVFGRVHLIPSCSERGYFLSLWTSHSDHIGYMVKVAMALVEAGFAPELQSPPAIVAQLTGTDSVRITRRPRIYLLPGEVRTEMALPDREVIGVSAYEALVEAIAWEPVSPVLPS